jgi:hypothetical protein
MKPNIHYISFCSEGEPYDKGLNLSNSKQILINNLKDTDIKYFFYSPRFLKENGFSEYVKEYENPGLVSMNPNMNLVGFCAWKPLIMLLELEKMNDGDILVYRDCNCEKYGQLKDFDNFEKNITEIFDIVNFDFFVPIENNRSTIGGYCKSNVIRELAINKEFTRNFPLLVVNILICKKSNISIDILNEWRKNCIIDKYIDGEQHGELYPEFQWHTPEQGILGVLISNYVYEGKYNIPKNYPNLMLLNRNINEKIIIDKIVNNNNNNENFDNINYSIIPYIVCFIFVLLLFILLKYKNFYKRFYKFIKNN